MDKNFPKATIKLSNMKVNFKKISSYGNEGKQMLSFQLSQKVYEKDKSLPARYDNFQCIAFDKIDTNSVQDGDIVTVTGSFQTKIYNGNIQLSVVVDKIEKVNVQATQKSPSTITVDDLPF